MSIKSIFAFFTHSQSKVNICEGIKKLKIFFYWHARKRGRVNPSLYIKIEKVAFLLETFKGQLDRA